MVAIFTGYEIHETGHDPYRVGEIHEVIKYALDVVRERGPFSGMEDWDNDNIEAWLHNALEREEEIDLYVSAAAYSFKVIYAYMGDESETRVDS